MLGKTGKFLWKNLVWDSSASLASNLAWGGVTAVSLVGIPFTGGASVAGAMAARASARALVRAGSKTLVKEAGKQAAKITAKEGAEQAGKQVAKESAEQITKQVTKEAAESTVKKNMTSQVFNGVTNTGKTLFTKPTGKKTFQTTVGPETLKANPVLKNKLVKSDRKMIEAGATLTEVTAHTGRRLGFKRTAATTAAGVAGYKTLTNEEKITPETTEKLQNETSSPKNTEPATEGDTYNSGSFIDTIESKTGLNVPDGAEKTIDEGLNNGFNYFANSGIGNFFANNGIWGSLAAAGLAFMVSKPLLERAMGGGFISTVLTIGIAIAAATMLPGAIAEARSETKQKTALDQNKDDMTAAKDIPEKKTPAAEIQDPAYAP